MPERKKGKVLFTVRQPKDWTKVINWLYAILFTAFIVLAVESFVTYERSYDDTDDPIFEKRSGMKLYIDYGTGCHWIRVGFFNNMVPRMNVHGRQVCIKADQRKSSISS